MQKSMTGSGSEARTPMIKSKLTDRTAILWIIVLEGNVTIFCIVNIWKVILKIKELVGCFG